jgi:hypothetical protein
VPFIAGGVNEGNERRLIRCIREHAQAITASLGFQIGSRGQND